MGTYDLTLERGADTIAAGAAKFGSAGLGSGGVYGSSTLLPGLVEGSAFGPFTVDAWIKLPAGSTGVAVAVGDTATGLWFGQNNGDLEASLGAGGTTLTLTTGVAIADGAWHLVSVTWTGGATGTYTVYLDGVSKGSLEGTPTFGSATDDFLAVGGYGVNGSYDWLGSIDEVSFSNVDQYSGNFAPPSAAFSTSRTGQVALYHFDGDATDSNASEVEPSIPASDANIIYSPFNWDVGESNAKTINPGAYLRAVIDGNVSSIAAAFDMTNVTYPPAIAWRVDDGPWERVSAASSVSLTIPTDTSWTSHVVEIILVANDFNSNRWTTDATALKFLGFVCSGETRAIQRRPLNVIVFGDSITEALYSLKDVDESGPPSNLAQSDARQGWAYELTNNLGAEVGVIGFGGTGIVAGYVDVPGMLLSYNLIFDGVARSFSDPAPDLIVICTGPNEASVSGASWQSDCEEFLNDILAAAPGVPIMLMETFDGAHGADAQAAATGCDFPALVHYVDTTGWHSTADGSSAGGVGIHPWGYDNTQNLGPRAGRAARAILSGQSEMFINVGGQAVGVTPIVNEGGS